MNHAVLFPGQGSQSLGMLSELSNPAVQATLTEASDALGFDMAGLIAEGPEARLNQTEFTQPALLTAGIAAWRAWAAQGDSPLPVALAGHSLGEYTALVAGGSLAFHDALHLVRLRGQLMQSAVPEGEGGMAAIIGMDDAAVEALCKQYSGDGVLQAVNFNAPGQVVVAGSKDAMNWLASNGEALGARRMLPLSVSVPSHCALMQPAAEALWEALQDVSIVSPSIPVLHNLDAAQRTDPQHIREALRDQLHRPVQWTRTQLALEGLGVQAVLECGPGKVLSGLMRRTVKAIKALPLQDDAAQAAARQHLTGE